jgi:hypothetical protein
MSIEYTGDQYYISGFVEGVIVDGDRKLLVVTGLEQAHQDGVDSEEKVSQVYGL